MTPFKTGMLRACLPAFGLIVALLLFHFFHDPYKVIGPDLLKVRMWGDYRITPWKFSNELAGVRDDGLMFAQTEGKKRGWISARIYGMQPGDLMRLRGEARAGDIVRGKASWQCGRIGLTYSDADNKSRRDYPHVTGMLTGTCDWVSFELLSEVQDFADYGKVWINNWGRGGKYEVRNLSLYPLRLKHTGPFYFWGAVVCVAGLGGWYSRRFNLFKRSWGRLVILISIAIVTGVLLPGKLVKDAPEVTARIMDKGAEKVADSASVQKMLPALEESSETRWVLAEYKDRAVEWVKNQNPHKWGHAGLFFLFGLACGLCFLSSNIPARLYTFHHQDATKLLNLLFGVLIFSVAAELIQVVAISRSIGFDDWMLNIYGAAGGLFLFVLFHLGQHPVRRLLKLIKK